MTSWPSHPSVAAVLDPVGSVMNGILRDAWVSRHHAFRVVMTRLSFGFAELLEHLPAALVAVRRELRLAGRS